MERITAKMVSHKSRCRTWPNIAASITFAGLIACDSGRDSTTHQIQPGVPVAATVASDGTAVTGAPAPEVVQLTKMEEVDLKKYVTVGNVAGEYVLVCDPKPTSSRACPVAFPRIRSEIICSSGKIRSGSCRARKSP